MIFLVSQSKGRQKLLHSSGVDFLTIKTHFDEDAFEHNSISDHQKLVLFLAEQKITHKYTEPIHNFFHTHPNTTYCFAISADTIVVLGNGMRLQKPVSLEELYGWLELKQKYGVTALTGYCIEKLAYDKANKQLTIENSICTYEETKIVYSFPKNISLVKKHITADCLLSSGGLNIDDDVMMQYVQRIEGSYTNVIGLPIAQIFAHMRIMGHCL